MSKINLLFCLAITAISFAQTPSVKISPDLSPASPATVGMSDTRLKRIDAMLKQAVKDGDIPFAEIEYQFLTDSGIPFQPRLRNLDILANL